MSFRQRAEVLLPDEESVFPFCLRVVAGEVVGVLFM
jgi:hypothetical protein